MLCQGCHVCGRPVMSPLNSNAQRCSPRSWHVAGSPAHAAQHSMRPAAAAMQPLEAGGAQGKRGAEGRRFSRCHATCPAAASAADGDEGRESAQSPVCVTRRAATAWAALAGSYTVSGLLPPPSAAADTAPVPAPASLGSAGQRRIKPTLGAAITRSVYDAVIQQQVWCSNHVHVTGTHDMALSPEL